MARSWHKHALLDRVWQEALACRAQTGRRSVRDFAAALYWRRQGVSRRQGRLCDAARLMQHRGEPLRDIRALESALVDAADWGNVVAARVALDGGADPNCRGSVSPCDSALHYAAGRGRLACVQLLLDRGATVDSLNDEGKTPLHRAVSNEHPACARLLLSHGAAVDAMDSLGWRPMHHAAHAGNLTCLRLVLDERSAAVNAVTHSDSGGDTPLHCAAAHGFSECAQLLLDHGADVNAVRASDGWTPLHMNARNGSLPCLQLLLARGAATDCKAHDSQTPLHLTAQEGHRDCMRSLLEHGAAIDSRCSGSTALHYSAFCGHLECTLLLLDSGAAIGVLDYDGDTPLSCAAIMSLEEAGQNALECARLLLARGAALDDESSSALVSCVTAMRARDIAFLLLWRGVHVPSPYLDEAVEEGATENLLLDLTLTEWQSGGLRCWRRDVHALFPAAVRADVAATLLATLGSFDDGSAGADDAPRAARQQNPLLTLRQQHVLDMVFTALLLAHMGGPAAVANPAPPAAQPESSGDDE